MTKPSADPQVHQLSEKTADLALINFIHEEKFRRVMLVTGSASFSWFLGRDFLQSLGQRAKILRWKHQAPNPDFPGLLDGLRVASEFRPDVIIGIGGGNVLDMAKMIAGSLAKTPAVSFQGLLSELSKRSVSLVLVPTTAGSGAEATHFSVLYKNQVKYSIYGPSLLADHVFLDSALVTSGSQIQKSSSGLDALCQCIESLWSKGQTLESQSHAREGLKLAVANLGPFVGGDDGRAPDLQWAAYLSGRAINISKTTGPHAYSYFLTQHENVPHGIAVASTMGAFIDYHNGLGADENNQEGVPLRESMKIVNEILSIDENRTGKDFFTEIFSQLGLSEPQSYWPQKSEKRTLWASSANSERLSNHPVFARLETVLDF